MKLDENQKQLERTIRCIHSKSEQYKTILITSPYLYLVVTRVNHHTTNLWIAWRNSIIKDTTENPLRRKISWLTMTRSWKREKGDEINILRGRAVVSSLGS